MQRLKIERWFSRLVSPKGKVYWRRKRVSVKLSAQWPQRYREAWVHYGVARVVRLVKEDRGCDVREAWNEVQRMVND